MKTAVIIVNYNKKDLLEKCLTSLVHTKKCDHTVFVVDNGSKDGSIEMVQRSFPYVAMIEMGYNAGFCKGNNAGIHEAISQEYDVIVLLNNDTEVDGYFLHELTKLIDVEKKIGMVAPKILMFANKNTYDSAGLLITVDGLALNRLIGQSLAQDGHPCEVFCPTGAAAAFHVDVLKDIKQDGMYFDEDYAYYLEDVDMGWRARLRGWSCVYNPQSVVYHHKNATSGEYSAFIAFYTNRNLYYNIIKNYPGISCLRAMVYSVIRYPYLFVLALCHKSVASRYTHTIAMRELMTITMRGLWDVGKNFVRLYKKRRYIQRRKIAQDHMRWFKDFGVGFVESKK